MSNPLFAFIPLALLALGFSACKNHLQGKQETTGGWIKYENNPVLGGNLGSIFDISVLHDQPEKFSIYCSWRPQRSIALSSSQDGLHWLKPVICLAYNDSSGWENDVNRPVVIYKDGIYHRWYSGGEQYEPDAIGYASSKDGIHWVKYGGNPVFSNNRNNVWEQDKVTACQVIRRAKDYLMFYIGFKNIDYAQIGMARWKNGIDHWERYAANPIIKPGQTWDSSAVYKPYAIPDSNRWLLYFNGRRNNMEQIGIAIHEGLDLGF